MKIIGLTGGSGAGKTTVAKILEEYGAYILDADVTARKVTEPGQPALDEIEKEWQGVVIDGCLERKALAAIVFNSSQELHKLNAITHKYIIDKIKQEISASDASVFVIDAIALFESGLADLCNVTVAVVADKEVRLKRIMARDDLTENEALMRINAQKSDSFYVDNCDYTIVNNGDIDAMNEEIGRIIKGS